MDYAKFKLSNAMALPMVGEGLNAQVYPHPTNNDQLVRVPHSVLEKSKVPKVIQPTPVQDIFPDRNFGQAVAEYVPAGQDPKYPIQIIKRVEGETHRGIGPYDQYGNETAARQQMRSVNKLRKYPQEAFNQYRADIRDLYNAGADLDIKPDNIILNKQGINHVDVGLPKDMTRYRPTAWDDDLTPRMKDFYTKFGLQGVSDRDVFPAKSSPRKMAAIQKALDIIASKIQGAKQAVPALAMGTGVLPAYGSIKEGKEQGINPMGKFLSNMIPWDTVAPTGRGTVKNLKTGEEYKEMY